MLNAELGATCQDFALLCWLQGVMTLTSLQGPGMAGGRQRWQSLGCIAHPLGLGSSRAAVRVAVTLSADSEWKVEDEGADPWWVILHGVDWCPPPLGVISIWQGRC